MTDPVTVAVLCESDADFRVARGLLERCLQDAGLQNTDIKFIDFGSYATFCAFKNVDKEFSYRLKISNPNSFLRAKFKGIPDTNGDRGPVLKFSSLPTVESADVLIITRDVDNQPERIQHIDSIVGILVAKGKIVAWGMADRLRESWVLSGFVPRATHEHTAHRQWKSKLSFDPLQEPERLRGDHPPNSAKHGLDTLTGNDYSREEECWRETPLAHLQERGQDNGLATFIKRLIDVSTQIKLLIDEREEY